ncbi:uncharacterized protein LOC134839846 [Symsagittifera roscoffensis]|uniref:uncharacterized protein LOC134839846 n=1 Tax=Symsagittifera roscoffensis TaxID=84072 RepID=UPI00307C383E
MLKPFVFLFTLVNFIICCAYALKYLKDSSMFSQSDVLISSMGVLDFVSAMMLMVGTSLFANQPTNVHNSLVEVSCTFIYAGYTLGSRTTYLMMLLIAVTRYVAICRPQDYYTWFSRPKLNFYLALLLAVSLGQMSVQQLISCHLPMSWFNLLGGDSLAEKVERSHAHYNMFKQLWQINAFEKFGLVILTLSIITTLYIKIINHINFVTPTQLANSDDAAQVRSIRRTFIIYLVYLYLIMFPQTGMELFFTYEFLTQHDIWTNPETFYKNLRLLVGTQFVYSSIYVLNPITVFWLNPDHGATINHFFNSLFELTGLYVLDEGAVFLSMAMAAVYNNSDKNKRGNIT